MSRFQEGVKNFLSKEVFPYIERTEAALNSLCSSASIRPNSSYIKNNSRIIASDPDVVRLLENLSITCSRLNSTYRTKEAIKQFCSNRVNTCGGENQAASKLRTVLITIFNINFFGCCSNKTTKYSGQRK